MSSSPVLLTGASGNVGFVILEQLLSSDHHVNAVLRSFSKSKSFFESKFPDAISTGKLTFTEIPDMAAADAFHSAAKGCSAVIHVATPLSSGDFLKTMIEPAWKINENILNAAAASGTVARVIVTGSIVSVMRFPADLQSDQTFSEKNFNSIPLEDSVEALPFAYQYSKVSSEKKAWEYMETHKPDFDLIFLLAPGILGRSPEPAFTATKESLGGRGSIYNLFDQEQVGSVFPYIMDVDDVARIHIKSLDFSIPGNERYLFHAAKISANRVTDHIRQSFPELRSRVPAGGEGDGWPVQMAKTDISKAQKVFGTDWKGWQESVETTVRGILAFESVESQVAQI